MSRRRQAVKRPLIPDARYNSTLVTNLVNMIMERGKRSLAERIVYTAFERLSDKLQKGNPVDLVMSALENTRPKLEVKSRRVGGATYQVPVEVSPERQQSLAFRWMVGIARKRKGVPSRNRLRCAERARRIKSIRAVGDCIKIGCACSRDASSGCRSDCCYRYFAPTH